ncbi:MAG: s-methyl-5-thioribose-1-phosphate isomerase [Clostridia bacterium]|nr:s-methyl-5-thioribose-1-phosphate isomerase [Clostridia bacterium]
MREDHDLAPLLQYENIAWYEDGAVRLLDRRVYPAEERFVVCRTYAEVRDAIRSMVTQSYGPFHAAVMGMALAAYACRDMPAGRQAAYLAEAGDALANARPTTAWKMRRWTDEALRTAQEALAAGERPLDAIQKHALDKFNARYRRIAAAGRHLAALVPAGGAVMTQCYADVELGMLLRALRENGNAARFFCPETRPYLQGARLTASVILDMGFEVTLITDNMPAWTMREKRIDMFTSAADVICMDGHIVNKVGTLQIALAADYLGIPYYVSGVPDASHPTTEGLRIEERDPEEVLCFMGRRSCKPGVRAWYPAFDVTPPALVAGVATDQGILAPTALADYRFF